MYFLSKPATLDVLQGFFILVKFRKVAQLQQRSSWMLASAARPCSEGPMSINYCKYHVSTPWNWRVGRLGKSGVMPKAYFLGVQASIPWSVEEGRACNWKVYELCSFMFIVFTHLLVLVQLRTQICYDMLALLHNRVRSPFAKRSVFVGYFGINQNWITSRTHVA